LGEASVAAAWTGRIVCLHRSRGRGGSRCGRDIGCSLASPHQVRAPGRTLRFHRPTSETCVGDCDLQIAADRGP